METGAFSEDSVENTLEEYVDAPSLIDAVGSESLPSVTKAKQANAIIARTKCSLVGIVVVLFSCSVVL